MARYEHLPLYKQTYDLLFEFHKLIPTLPRKYKFILGSEIISDLTNSVLFIIKINSINDKKELLDELILIFEKVKIQIRIMKSLEIISTKLYFKLSEKIVCLLKQCEGWKKNV